MVEKVAILQLTRGEVDALLTALLDYTNATFTPAERDAYTKLETAIEDLETE